MERLQDEERGETSNSQTVLTKQLRIACWAGEAPTMVSTPLARRIVDRQMLN
jgi:hypothetical protein